MASLNDSSTERPARRIQHALTDFQDRGWQTGTFRALAISALAASIVAAPLAILREMTSWALGYLAPLAFFIALEGVISTNHLGRPEWRDRRGLAYRLGEILFIVLAARLAVWAFATGWPDLNALGTLLRHPGVALDAQTLFTASLLLAVWGLAIGVAADFLDLAIQPDEVAAQELHDWGDSRSYLRLSRPVGRGEIVARFTARWAWGGLPLVLFTGLSQLTINVDVRGALRFALTGTGLQPDVLIGLLCYFLVGLLLLSDARLAMLRGRWYNERVIIAPALLRRWRWLGLVVLLVIGAAALFLPLGPVTPLADALSWLLALLVRAGMFLIMLLMYLLSVLLHPLRSLLSEREEAPPELAPAPPSQAEMIERMSLPDWLGGALVWAVVGLAGGYLLFNFLRAYGWPGGPWLEKFATLRFWWRARRAQVGAAVQKQLSALRARLPWPRAAVGGGLRPRSLRPGALPPRGKVRYYYLRAAQRAADQGRARPPHATPLEYARDLEATWPEAEDDVQGLTEAFLAARYTPREIAADEARGVQQVWRRVMQALRQPAANDRPQDADLLITRKQDADLPD